VIIAWRTEIINHIHRDNNGSTRNTRMCCWLWLWPGVRPCVLIVGGLERVLMPSPVCGSGAKAPRKFLKYDVHTCMVHFYSYQELTTSWRLSVFGCTQKFLINFATNPTSSHEGKWGVRLFTARRSGCCIVFGVSVCLSVRLDVCPGLLALLSTFTYPYPLSPVAAGCVIQPWADSSVVLLLIVIDLYMLYQHSRCLHMHSLLTKCDYMSTTFWDVI